MAPLSRPVPISEPQELMSCQALSDSAKPSPLFCSPSSVTHRRIIFPSLYSNRCQDDSSSINDALQETTVNKSSSSISSSSSPRFARDDKDNALINALSFRSPGLPPVSPRMCDELGLDMPVVSLGSSRKSPPKQISVKKQKKVATPARTALSQNDTQLLNELPSPFDLRSPGLPPKKARICDELGLDVSSMRLDDMSIPSYRGVNKSKALNDKHFVPKQAAGVTRTPSGSNPSPQRQGRIDRRRMNFTTPKPPASKRQSSLPSSCDSSVHDNVEVTKKLPSILRPSKYGKGDKNPAVPSLVPCDSSHSSCETLHSQHSSCEDVRKCRSRISFDPRVWVVEYQQSPEEMERAWFTPEELDRFRKETIARLVAHNTELLPTGTGFIVQRGNISSTKAVFAMPAMSAAGEDEDTDETDVVDAVNREIQNILVVDPHEVCAKLFARDLKRMIPNVNVSSAHSSEEARKQMADTKFDIIIVEERLRHCHQHGSPDQWTTKAEEVWRTSGSAFIKVLAQEKQACTPEERCLFIAVSAHLDKDKDKMQKNGADFLWAKPPPRMDEIIRDVLLKALLVKREKLELSDRLFGGIMRSP